MRIAMGALLGLDPDEAGRGAAAAAHFERALGYYGIDYGLRLLRGPGSPWRRMIASREVLDEIVFGEVSRRRADPDPSRKDILSLLVGARGEGGEAFTDREVRDQVMTLMFAGHDTSTSTLTFMMHELGRHPEVIGRLCEEQDRVLSGGVPTIDQLEGEMPYLEMVLDEVLRLYPPAWIGPRRAVREFEFGGYTVPRGAYVNYCSWASHRLPEVFPDPEAFIPERFTRERKAALPRGAYVPFGGGSRICIGKRFGQTEVKLVATMLLQRLRLGALPGRTVTVRQMPTLSPKGGLRMRVEERMAY
jgi:cytochrome P450